MAFSKNYLFLVIITGSGFLFLVNTILWQRLTGKDIKNEFSINNKIRLEELKVCELES